MNSLFKGFSVVVCTSLCFNLFYSPTFAQDKKLTYEQVYLFGEPRIFNSLPRITGWFDDNHYIFRKQDSVNNQLVKIEAEGGTENLLLDYNEINKNLRDTKFSADRNVGIADDYSGILFYQDNDLYYYSVLKKNWIRLTKNPDEEKNPMFSPNGKRVAFTRNKDLYVVDVESGKEIRLTKDASEVIYNGYASWVYMEEIIGRSLRYRAFWWSPNSEMIAFLNFDDSDVPLFPLVSYDDLHGNVEYQRYPKPGDPNPKVKLGVAHINKNKIVWTDEDEKIDQYTAWPNWSPDSKFLFYQIINRAQNDIQIRSADPNTGKNKLIYEEKQSAWVEFFEDVQILNNNQGFILRSDVDGWRHLYFYDNDGKLKKQITSGEWFVSKIVLVDEKDEKIYFEANKNHMLETHLFVVNFDGSGLKQLTSAQGTYSAAVSASGKYFYSSYSSIDSPTKIDLYRGNGEFIRNIGDRKTELINQYDLGKTELFTIKTEDGIELPAMWALPPNFDENKKYPVIFSEYGGPERTEVTNSYSLFLERFFWAQNDVIYFSVDHRGSGYFGGKGKSYMYHNLGKWEIEDYTSAVKWLKKKSFVDSTKIGITGSSYGGYVVCMALTLGADYFTHGIADYSVTDWRLYDNVYTERYMGLPDENPEGYEYGSAITHANNYKGLLRIVHGMMDDNVHMQNVIQLVDRLETLNKHFELMLYPNERHGVGFRKRQHVLREYVNFWFKNFLGKDLFTD